MFFYLYLIMLGRIERNRLCFSKEDYRIIEETIIDYVLHRGLNAI